ncbi:hypothetical protein H5410_035797 [Solanum commersonii]|uniref:Uncharacterized protein n=1 Tax=Solanum commersonii TaxID=4109 RepID=A0A9J5Y2X1_SOLCO|nr:hypothetical protein H5410_035797 [Solanum commersonii]
MTLPTNTQTSLCAHLSVPYETTNLLSPSSFLRSPITKQTTSDSQQCLSSHFWLEGILLWLLASHGY